MNHFYNIALFLVANAAGFFSITLTYHVCIALNLFTPNAEMIDSGLLQQIYFSGTTITWMICALLSLGFFIFKERARWAFLSLPILLPIIYGLNVLLFKLDSLPS